MKVNIFFVGVTKFGKKLKAEKGFEGKIVVAVFKVSDDQVIVQIGFGRQFRPQGFATSYKFLHLILK